ncbi:hypothetical protein [Acholeplasma laidlawii]|uniref:hypothetical protein n=1 Tax=Acholeplasma laidlawii TaxID=2148 RepID=UPI001B37C0CB|nr:hypothetical protein [Acholeplasma laidlawii]
MDFNIGPTQDDLDMYIELQAFDVDIIVVTTKYDKVKSSHRLKQEKVIRSKFFEGQKIYFTSSETKFGIDKLINEEFSNE